MGRDIRLQTSPEKRAKLARPRQSRWIAAAAFAVLAATSSAPAMAAETGRSSGDPLPRYESLKADEVNYRKGPSSEYAIKWVLRRRHLPVRIIGEFDRWRRVELHTGERGWINRALLSERRYVIVLGEGAKLVEAPQPDAKGIADIEPTVPMRLRRCQREWCEVEARVSERTGPTHVAAPGAGDGRLKTVPTTEGDGSPAKSWFEEGWVLKRRLWGVD